ncbi:DNA-3-methyladenine glycosylase family protein [Mariniblastus fucicola]|uniref:DNA-3-methyladenine glycosylase II n=1 Tax=Mariniblastus fucicola TaxID=980251 RepID=A0A5B9PHJ4_9BACT|nr:DNA-3-methyladenine glycosylase [Mariniblastus fucicola]QEG24116.1 DNA-3-methyladenine glycosylase [Mariniblastus fucicola]
MSFSAQHVKAARLHLRKSDPKLGAIIKSVGPFTTKARRDRFGTLVRSIVSQQIATAAAEAIKSRLETAIEDNRKTARKRGQPYCPKTILDFSVDELREIGLSRQKATYVQSLAQHVVDGDVDLAEIHKLDDETIIESLTQVKGIGRWTAQMFLIFSLARLDVLPVDDLGVRTAVKNVYGLGDLPAKSEMEEIAEPWRPYASIASWYMWRSLELDEN